VKDTLARWRANFYTGLAIVLPAVISIALVKWLFGTVSNLTDPLLFFLPAQWTHDANGTTRWWWSCTALVLAIILIGLIGRLARYLLFKKILQLVDLALLRVPLLNKIYGAIKQVNEAFTTSNKSSFKQVVLIEFPKQGIYSVGFVTGERHGEVQQKTGQHMVSVFIPTTPNPTSGYLVLVPEKQLTQLEMSVADGIKFIISLGAVSPPYALNREISRETPPATITASLFELGPKA
jgi:uncharacterized membrane protein